MGPISFYHRAVSRKSRTALIIYLNSRYDIKGLKRIPTWQTLNLVRDGCFVYDRAEIEKIFEMVLQEAEEHGIVYDAQEKVFSLKRAERVVFSLEE